MLAAWQAHALKAQSNVQTLVQCEGKRVSALHRFLMRMRTVKEDGVNESFLTYRQDNQLLQRLYVFNTFQLVAKQREICKLSQLAQTFQPADVIEGQIQPSQVDLPTGPHV